VHRTWLDPDGFDRVRLGKAPIDTPRRAMGDLLGNAKFVSAWRTTMCLLPAKGSRPCYRYAACFRPCQWPLALSANHLSAMALSSSLRRLYIARDADAAGDVVQAVLSQRAETAGIEAIPLSPRLGDFNEDLHIFGLDALRVAVRIQLAPEDVARFLLLSATVE